MDSTAPMRVRSNLRPPMARYAAIPSTVTPSQPWGTTVCIFGAVETDAGSAGMARISGERRISAVADTC